MSQLSEKLYNHWSYFLLCIYGFVGMLTSIFFILRGLSTNQQNSDFALGLILLITSITSGIYTKIIGDMDSERAKTEYYKTVPEDRLHLAKKMFGDE